MARRTEIAIVIDRAQLAALNELAAHLKVSRSSIVRTAISSYLATKTSGLGVGTTAETAPDTAGKEGKPRRPF